MFTDTFNLPSATMTRINKLMIGTYDSIIDAQMASIRGYMELAENQTKSVTTIHNVEGIKNFVADQPQRLHQLMSQMSRDLHQFADIAAEFRNEASQLFQSLAGDNEPQEVSPKSNASIKSSAKKDATASS